MRCGVALETNQFRLRVRVGLATIVHTASFASACMYMQPITHPIQVGTSIAYVRL